MYQIQPIHMYREMLLGILQWQKRPAPRSDALQMIYQLANGRRLFAPDLTTAAYEALMDPVYRQMDEEIRALAGRKPRLIRDPATGYGSPASETVAHKVKDTSSRYEAPLRYTEPCSPEGVNRTEKAWQIVIQQEFIRALRIMENWREAITDKDLLLFEYDNVQKSVHELLLEAVRKETDTIQQILVYELAALRKEIGWRRRDSLPDVEPDPFPEPDPEGVKVLKSGWWWPMKMERLLDGWTAKYYNTAPIHEMATLMNDLSEELDCRKEAGISHTEAAGLFRHFQMILLLIILKKADTEKLKRDVQSVTHAEQLLRELDSLLMRRGQTRDETGQIIDYAILLDKAGAEHDIQRFPMISERTDTIKQILTHTFSAPPPSGETRKELHSYSSGRLPTAAERLKHHFLTFDEVVELQQSTPGNVQRLLTNLGVEIIKRGDVKYVNYNDYTNAHIRSGKKE